MAGHHPSLKQRLLAGETAYGIFLCSASPVVAELLGFAGYDLVVVDMEHGPGSTLSSLALLQALAGTGAQAVVRVAENSAVELKKALDIGPAGVVVPMVDSAEAARRVVAACRYPPDGVRGCAPSIARASRYGFNPHYLSAYEHDLLITVQIESDLAVGRIAEIAAVDGVDCLFIGPTDLSASVGRLGEPGHEDVQRLLKHAEDAILASGKLLGGFLPPLSSSSPHEMFLRGYRLVCGGTDIGLLREAAWADILKARGGAGMPRLEGGGGQQLQQQQQRVLLPASSGLRNSSSSHRPLAPAGRHSLGVAHSGTPSLHRGFGSSPYAGQHMGLGGINPAAGVGGVPAGGARVVSRRGGRGTPKVCSHCHVPVKGHKQHCPALNQQLHQKKLKHSEDPSGPEDPPSSSDTDTHPEGSSHESPRKRASVELE
eukprot:jgi/Mesen1/7328/ME000376S06490